MKLPKLSMELRRTPKTVDIEKSGGVEASAVHKDSTSPKNSPKRANLVEIGAAPRVDLLPLEVRADRRAAQNVRRAWFGVGVVAASMVIAVGASTVYSAAASSDLANAQAQTGVLNASQSQFAKVRTTENLVTLIKAAQNVGGATEIDWNDYLAKVQASLPSGVSISTVTLDSASPLTSYAQASAPLEGQRIATITFTATSKVLPSVPAWLDGLSELPGYADANPGSVTLTDGLYTANVTLHINEAAYSGRYTSKGK